MNSLKSNNFYDQERKSLILTDKDLRAISADIIESYAENTHHIDFSHNRLTDLTWIREFSDCEELILDDNHFAENSLSRLMGEFKKVKVLMLNKNEFADLHITIEHLSRLFPNLEYLSLHGNAICPDGLGLRPFGDYIQYSYEYYRSYVINAFQNLKFLDHTSTEQTETYPRRNRSNSAYDIFKEKLGGFINNSFLRRQSLQINENNYFNTREDNMIDDTESL